MDYKVQIHIDTGNYYHLDKLLRCKFLFYIAVLMIFLLHYLYLLIHIRLQLILMASNHYLLAWQFQSVLPLPDTWED